MDASQIAHLVEKAVLYAGPLLPSIVVAATPYPKASKALRVISHVLQFCSVLSHRDCPGTLKAPGRVDRPSDDPVEDEPAVRERPEPEPKSRDERSEGEPVGGQSEVEFLRGLVLRFLGFADKPQTRSRRAPRGPRRRRR